MRTLALGSALLVFALSRSAGGEALATSAAARSERAAANVVWVLGDDDVLHPSSASVPASPAPGIGDRDGYRLFFDGYGARYSGRENRLDLALAGVSRGYLPKLSTRAALRLGLDWGKFGAAGPGAPGVLEDGGTFIDATVELCRASACTLGVTLYPIDTDTWRLGHVDELAWGGTRTSRGDAIFPDAEGRVPGARVQLVLPGFSLYGGVKTAELRETVPGLAARVAETNWGFLGGASADVTRFLRVESEAGYFEQGRLEQPGVEGRLAYTAGATARVVLHEGREEPSAPEFFVEPVSTRRVARRLGREAPADSANLASGTAGEAPGVASDRTWALAVEGAYLAQRLQDFDARRSTVLQPARALATYGTLVAGPLETRLSVMVRELAFVLRNAPSIPRSSSIPRAARRGDELSLGAGLSFTVARLALTPSLDLGLRFPANLRAKPSLDRFGQDWAPTLVIAGPNRVQTLEPGAGPVPIFHARLSLGWQASALLSAVVWVSYRRDNNATRVELDERGFARERRFIAPDFVGGGLGARARF